jgi:hypothetical protein
MTVSDERSRRILAACRLELESRLAGKLEAENVDPLPGDPVSSERSVASANEPIERRIVNLPNRWLRWATAAAAVIAIGFILVLRNRPGSTAGTIDLERPTIVDAFALARQVEAGRTGDPRFDLNGDGTVGADDAHLLAQRAVTLPEGGAL